MESMLVHARLKSWVHFCSHVIGWLTFYLKQGWCLEQLLFLSRKLSLPLFLFHVFWVEWMPQSGGWGVFPGLHDLFGVDVWTDRGQKNTITHFLGVLRESTYFWIRLILAKYNPGAAGMPYCRNWTWEWSHIDGFRDESWREPRFWWHHLNLWTEACLKPNLNTSLLAYSWFLLGVLSFPKERT